eukprot:GHUV01005391.1.p1 GENE.GHUV01005391.1~~GHUV01005391.1.p1  ORF type:complete len:295 (+),score=71.04 GHUV01005391.1:405-1289(+)
MCAFLTPPLSTTALPKALIGITCTCIVLARARQRQSREAARSASAKTMDGGTILERRAGGSVTGGVNPKVASAAVALGHVQALASFTKLVSSVRVYRLLQSSLQSMWLMVAMGAAIVKAWAEGLQKQQADAHHAVIPAVQVEAVKSFCGTWVKDIGSSEPMDSFCDMFGVPRFLRQATRLMSGLEVTILGDALLVKQVCKIGFMSMTESYPLDGVHSSVQRRRDMRSGKQLGKLVSAAEGQMQLRVVFDGRLPGEALDTLQLQEDGNTLVVQHKASLMGKGSAHFREVYRRVKR